MIEITTTAKILCGLLFGGLILLIEWWKLKELPASLEKYIVAILGGVATIESIQIISIAMLETDEKLGVLAQFRITMIVGAVAVLWVTMVAPVKKAIS